MKAVKYDPDPSGVAQVQKTWVLPPGSDLTAFLFLNPSSATGQRRCCSPELLSGTLLHVNCLDSSTPSRTPHVSKHPSRGGAEGKRTRYAIVDLMMVNAQAGRRVGRVGRLNCCCETGSGLTAVERVRNLRPKPDAERRGFVTSDQYALKPMPGISTGHHHQVYELGGSSRIIRAAGRIIKPRGRRSIRHMMILLCRGGTNSFLPHIPWGRGVFGWKYPPGAAWWA